MNLEKISELVKFEISSYEKRSEFVHNSSFHLPSDSLIGLLCEMQPILSVGCGLGFTESLAIKKNCDIVCVDLYPDPKENRYFDNSATSYTEVIKMDAVQAVLKWPERNVFMAWPPYNRPMADNVAQAMAPGGTLIYIGEGAGGCTGDDGFFFTLEKEFQEIETEANIPRWRGIYDEVRVFKKHQSKK
jgi:hypothetical protein